MASSFSGPLAVMLATEEPSRVRGLILSASFVRPPRRWLSHFRFVTLTPIVWATRVTRRIPVWMKTPTDPRRIAKAETWSRVSARTLAARVHAIIRVDVTDRLRSCAQPLLYVSYEDDEAVPRDNGEQIVRQHQSAQWVTLPGRHLAMFEQPELLAEEVDRFVRGVESARG
jgi:pimeloyl-ACP methyl ester carboxylesterase